MKRIFSIMYNNIILISKKLSGIIRKKFLILKEMDEDVKQEFKKWILFSLFITILPCIIRSIVIIFSLKFNQFETLASSGEFFIYSVSLLAPTLYLINSYFGNEIKKYKEFPYMRALMVTIVGIIIFTLITSQQVFNLVLNQLMIIITSVLIFVYSIYLSVISKIIEIKCLLNQNTLRDAEKEDIDKLSTQIDEMS